MKQRRRKTVFRAGAKRFRRPGTPAALLAALALAMLTLAACGVLAGSYFGWLRLPDALQAQVDILPDLRAKNGTLHAGGAQPVETGYYQAVFNQSPLVDGGGACGIEFENPAANRYNARLALYDGITGVLLGSTKRVDPGRYVESLRLNAALPAGEHPALAVIELFEGRTPAGSLSFKVTLRAAGKEGE